MNTPTRTALITGGTRGIGLGIARALAADGYRVALNGVRHEREVAPILEEIEQICPGVIYCRGDISDPNARSQVIDDVRSTFGRLDVLVNNAGIAPPTRADIMFADEAAFDRIISVNLKGPYFLTQLASRWMTEQSHTFPDYNPTIINITSISAAVASTNRGEYCVSKAAMSMASQLWAVRLAEFGIPVYEVRPGLIHTDMTASVTQKYDQLIASGLLLEGRWGTPEDIGKAVSMLARRDLPYATGTVLTLDGGLTIHRL